MNLRKRRNSGFALAMISMFVFVLLFVFSNNKTSNDSFELIVNGTKVQDAVIHNINGNIYVPLKEIAIGMGDSFEKNNNIVIIKKNGDKYMFFENNPYIFKKNGKIGFISTRFYLFGAPIPNNIKLHVENGEIFIPVKDNPIYDCTIKTGEEVTRIYVGEIVEEKKVEKKYSDDFETHTERIDYLRELGFKKTSENAVIYNPVNESIHGGLLEVRKDSLYSRTVIVVRSWGSEYRPETKDVKIYAKKLFDFYLSEESSEKLIAIIDGFTQKKGEKYLENKFKLGNKTLYMEADKNTGFLYIYIDN